MAGFDFALTSDNEVRSPMNIDGQLCYTNEILFFLDEVMVAKDGSVSGVKVRKCSVSQYSP